MLLEAPRRYGKTSLLKALSRGWREADGALAVSVDFSSVLTIEEASRRVADAYAPDSHGRLGELLGELLATIRLRLGPLEVGPLPRLRDDPATALHALLELPVQIAQRTGKRSLVCLDEFQDVLAVPGLDGLLRSHLQHHGEQVSYAFAGSEPSLLRELFHKRSRPLYGQAHPVCLQPIDPELLARAISQRFAASGRTAHEAAALIAGLGAGHPQRTMLLAWHLWQLTPHGTSADATTARRAIEQALHVREHELDAVERSFIANERRVALALATGSHPPAPKPSTRRAWRPARPPSRRCARWPGAARPPTMVARGGI